MQIRRAPTLRLVEPSHPRKRSLTPSTSSRASTPTVDSSLSSLTLSNHQSNPSSLLSNPIFGLPSLSARSQTPDPRGGMDIDSTHGRDEYDDDDERSRDPDAMDWSPTRQDPLRRDDSGFQLRPQRFYAPEEPTGLENLFERTIKLADSDEPSGRRERTTAMRANGGSSSRRTYAAVAAVASLMTAVSLGVWWQRDRWLVSRT